MIIPSLDYIQDTIVRLYQGNYNQKTLYKYQIIKKIHQYIDEGAKQIHLVDLCGCKNPLDRKKDIKNILSINKKTIFQVGGGIRSTDDLKSLFLNGVSKVVLGTVSIIKPEKLKKWLKFFNSNNIILAIDVKINSNNQNKVAINGWKEITNITLEQLINTFLPYGLKHVLCTDISRDGTFFGPNFHLYDYLVQTFPTISFQASGGISELNDIKIKKIGVKNIIIGKALLDKKFTLPEAIQCWQSV
ncbi:phosphoribosylformimino-5-aminoimidazole carboxamide ribotide isomerase [Buchnera aphidicola (Cinara tujafilina)]|uniref:1-(5-phosphoribosyl)-5-[(5-phosphoribosylamino)methylideneamino] imidazole-4-carboxamide isomerase n=1 Tax=Buchnera aphidicola (Cinara tujafilina) TaxID=261317 RepID=F7WZ11_9GAMM|nr:1-(5-phosphoribosyl)-5-[(5-phosphoribosylamino)methylideneamino] imidazole-4-carboxamide isomerase [Buchnera aphidicola]AEH39661.1 phosphoribosylformimino-5-aminoimidazole carboxamide ribotide isomerase [Buchnera aphidicola (Cinara tujafilina)]